MSDEAATLLIKDPTPGLYTYDTVETKRDIVSVAEQIISTGVEHIALVTIRLFYEKEHKPRANRSTHEANSTLYLLNNLRTLVRKTDRVLLLSHTMYFFLQGAHMQGGRIVQSRLWEALLWRIHNLSERDVLRPQQMTIGHSAYSIRDESIHDFIEAAAKASFSFDMQPEKATRKQAAQGKQVVDEIAEELPVLARKLGIPYLALLPRKLPQSLQQLVNPKLAHELRCYPLGRERNMLTVAMLNPEDHSALDRLKQETGLHIYPVLTHAQALQIALEQLV
jgi:hypothetical protein